MDEKNERIQFDKMKVFRECLELCDQSSAAEWNMEKLELLRLAIRKAISLRVQDSFEEIILTLEGIENLEKTTIIDPDIITLQINKLVVSLMDKLHSARDSITLQVQREVEKQKESYLQ